MKNLIIVKRITLAIAILGTVYCTPLLGMAINYLGFHLLAILLISLSIITIMKSYDLKIPKTGSTLMLIGVITGIVGAFPSYIVSLDSVFGPNVMNMRLDILDIPILYNILMLIGWGISVVATVYAFKDYNKQCRIEKEILYDMNEEKSN